MKERMKAQAVKMMTKLGVHELTIKQFEEQGLVSMTHGGTFGNFWVDKEVQAQINEIEEKYGCLVYYAVKNAMILGDDDRMDMISFFVVSKYEEEWPYDLDDVEDGIVFSYTKNLTYPDFSEFGSIGVKERFGGLVRVS